MSAVKPAAPRSGSASASPTSIGYGATPIERFDLYRAKSSSAPVMIMVHGGAWRSGRARDFADAAEMFVRAGVNFVVPDFINVIEAGGSLIPMVDQVRKCIAWIAKNGSELGIDPGKIYISGRSSGAHLASTALIADWEADFGLSGDTIKGALLSSGMYDLKPVRLSKRSSYIDFTDEMEHMLSAQRHLDRIRCPVVVAYGTYETPEFQRQARDFADALAKAGKDVRLLVGVGCNHFELPETLASPFGLLGRAALSLTGIEVHFRWKQEVSHQKRGGSA